VHFAAGRGAALGHRNAESGPGGINAGGQAAGSRPHDNGMLGGQLVLPREISPRSLSMGAWLTRRAIFGERGA